jgi:DNA-binding CsgD family transcriptional regulator
MNASRGRKIDEAGDPLDLARVRKSPLFYVIDDRLRVIFRSDGSVTDAFDLPPAIVTTTRRLTEQLIESNEASLLAMSSSSEMVRVLRLDAATAALHFAVVLEPFSGQNSVARAVRRFALSAREAEVLEGLMRGEGTNAIARRLEIKPPTVNEHLRKMGYKMNVKKRSDIVATVFRLR